MLRIASWYCKQGYSIIPIREKTINDKKVKTPYIKWDDYKSGTKRTTDQDLKDWYNKWPQAMIGLITGKVNNISVIDFDIHKINENQREQLKDIFEGFPDIQTPTAISPHGGYHFYFNYHPEFPHGQDIYPHVDGRNDNGYIILPPSNSPEIGVYKWDEKRKIKQIPFIDFPEQWLNKVKQHRNSINPYNSINSLYREDVTLNSQDVTKVTSSHKYFVEGRRDDDIFTVTNALMKARLKPEFVLQVLKLIARNLGGEFDEKVLEQKILSVMKRAERFERNITEEVREWVESQEGHFKVTECHNDITISHKKDKHACLMAIKRMCDEGILEKYGNQRGVYRKIESSVYEDWLNADQDSINIRLPFGMGEYVQLYPGDLIVIAGVKNAGKTALALNFIKLNLRLWDCYYHSSELVKQTFKLRISKDEDNTLQDWSRVKMTSGLSMLNAKDRVVKNALNVFDYIEGDDGEFYKIPAAMARIHRSLGDGIAVVCLQKPKERNYARGGEGTKDKAALYLTIDKEYPYHTCRITECKVFKEAGNPEGFLIKYKVVDGINLYSEGTLMPELEDRYRGVVK